VLPPQDAPKQLRGKEIKVISMVDEQGKVQRVEFQPEITDGAYARRLRESMLNNRYYPATDATGHPVPSTFETIVTIY
jgi:hypothetical protein